MSEYNFNYLEKETRKILTKEYCYIDFDKLNKYAQCLLKWGSTHNIVSSRMATDELLDNIIDSVVGGMFLCIPKVAYDAGSGGGLPGVPLAIVYPEIMFNLVESDRKKCSFLRLIKNNLNIANIEIQNIRIEKMKDLSFIISKAAFSHQNVGILGKSLACGGKLALWATEKTRDDLVTALQEEAAELKEEFLYILPKGKERRILLFTKS